MSINSLQQQVYNLIQQNAMLSRFMNYAQAAVGDYKFSAQGEDFNGWMLCDGRSLDVDAYPVLFDVISYNFGGSCGSFNLPNFSGRVYGAVGAGSGLTVRTVGDEVGTETHTLSLDEMPRHSHSNNTVAGSLGLVTANGVNTAFDTDSTAGEPNLYTAPVALTISPAGSNLPHNNMQPTLFAGNVFIYAGEYASDSNVV